MSNINMRCFWVMLLAAGMAVPSVSRSGDLPFERLATGSLYKDIPASVFLLASDEDWTEIWQRRHLGSNPMPAVPPVDFTRHSVVGFYAGPRGIAGHELTIVRVIEHPEKVTLVIDEKVPGLDCIGVTVMGNPYEFILISADVDRKPLDFELVMKPYDCTPSD